MRPRKYHYDDEQIIKLLNSGNSLVDCARLLDIPYQTFRNYYNKHIKNKEKLDTGMSRRKTRSDNREIPHGYVKLTKEQFREYMIDMGGY